MSIERMDGARAYLVNAPKASRDRGYNYWLRFTAANTDNDQLEIIEVTNKLDARHQIKVRGAVAWNF